MPTTTIKVNVYDRNALRTEVKKFYRLSVCFHCDLSLISTQAKSNGNSELQGCMFWTTSPLMIEPWFSTEIPRHPWENQKALEQGCRQIVLSPRKGAVNQKRLINTVLDRGPSLFVFTENSNPWLPRTITFFLKTVDNESKHINVLDQLNRPLPTFNYAAWSDSTPSYC